MQSHTAIEDTVTVHVKQQNGRCHDILVDSWNWVWIKEGTIGVMEHGSSFRARLTLHGKQTFLHSAIMPSIPGRTTKHIRGNCLDNRERNLGSFAKGESIPNEFRLNDTFVVLVVQQRNGLRHEILVDIDTWKWLKQYRVGVRDSGKGIYAIVYDAAGRNHLLHRVITQALDEEQVDHIRTKLDNRTSNLRLCTNAENGQNRHGSYSSSGERGVYWHAPTNKWLAGAQVNGIRHHLGLFETILEAAEVVKQFRTTNMPFSQEALKFKEIQNDLIT